MNTDMHADPVDEGTRREALRVIAENAEGPEDFEMLAAMLGLRDSTAQPCMRCKRPITRITNLGRAVASVDGMCASCYRTVRQEAGQEGDG